MAPSENPGLPVQPTAATLVDVCIATRKRPKMLGALLDSLAAQRLPGVDLRVIVVDNDADRSGESVVEERRASGLNLVYENEPERNIAAARNRSFHASRTNAEFLATIDDDAVAPPDWLATMLAAARSYEADVVFGAVRRVLPPDTAPSIRHSGVFELYNPPTGSTEWLVYNTANALLRRRVALGRPGPFREEYGLCGGEDTELFHSLSQQGARIIWCREAEVAETVLPERVRLGWILPRSFREGVTYYEIYRRWTLSSHTPFPLRWLSFGWWVFRQSLGVFRDSLLGVIDERRRGLVVAALKQLAFNCGIAARTAGFSYRPPHR